ncbi:MAG: glutamyl-tRNA reductase [Vicinamibacteria bacterium]|nr:glutamyl-tRNA reductase [Vicinamibacteria bacterium]
MILVVGISYKTAPVALREAAAFTAESLPAALARLRAECGLREAAVLSTCNRVEIYGEGDPWALDAACRLLAERMGQTPAALQAHLFSHSGEAAVRHAFLVAASLESMVLGEAQILGQFKDAFRLAEDAGSLGPALRGLRDRAIQAARRARSEAGIGEHAVSVSHVAVELAKKIFGDLSGRSVVLVGAGKMCALAGQRLVQAGARATVVGGRTLARAEELATELGAEAAPLESLPSLLRTADVVVSGTGAPGVVLRRQDVEAALSARCGRPLFLIDIAVPRDIDADVAKLPGTFLYDIDGLQAVAAANRREREREAQKAFALVEEAVAAFVAWERTLQVQPVLVALRRRAEEVKQSELHKARRRLAGLTAEQEAAVEAVAAAIVNKLLHPPTAFLREAAARGGAADEALLAARLLGVDPAAGSAPSASATTAAVAAVPATAR